MNKVINENERSEIRSLLYHNNEDEIKRKIKKITDQKLLYIYAYNYNWDNGFEIPQMIIDNKVCSLSTALLLFYRADGYVYLQEKNMETNLSQWAEFIKKLYCLILMSKFEKSEIQFKVPLSKVQIFKLKKELTPDEMVFVNNIEGIDLDIDL
ncbi:MAG: DUF4274 domain-containing protein [Lachnospiraceae bacterium]|nr:DUF4274 domain-containing protein [Lachnospiraceae bacterium]